MSTASGIVGAFTGPTQHSLAQKAWSLTPVNLPGVSEIIDGHLRGLIDGDSARRALLRQGVDYMGPVGVFADADQAAWGAAARSKIPVPDISMIYDAWIQGLLTDRQKEFFLRLAGVDDWPGFPARSFMELFANMYLDTPGAGEIWSAWTRGFVSTERRDAMLQRSGVSKDWYSELIPAMQTQPVAGELVAMRNRSLITDAQYRNQLERLGFDSSTWGDIFDRLREEIPGPGDLVRFGVSHAFQPEIAGPLLLYDERPEALDQWHDAVGLHRPLGFQIVSDGIVREAKWADMYWSAHWRKLGYETLATFLHRFRPDQIARYRAMGYNVDTFDLEKFKTLIRIDDYPKYARDYLAAISFRPLDSRWAIRGYTYDVLRPAQIKNVFLDQGYDSDRAQQATDIVIAQKEYRDRAPERAFELAQIRKAAVEIEHAYEVGTVDVNTASDALTAAFHSRPASEMALRTIDLKVRNGLLKAVIANVRHSYIAGAITDVEALAYLRNANVAEPRIALYLQGWITERGSVRKTATSAQILRWLQVGLIDAATAAIRLANLGWSNVDNLIQLAETGQKINKATVAAQAKDEKARAAQAKHLEALHKQAVAATKAIEGRVAKLTPVAKMQKWLAAGNITEQYFLNRLQAMGIPPDVRILMLKEAQGGEMRVHAAEAKARRAAEKTARGKDESLGTVKRWFTFGIIPEVAAREEMGILGVPQEDQDKYILQWEIDAQPKKDRPAAPAPPQGQ